jgi:hypothetical protein
MDELVAKLDVRPSDDAFFETFHSTLNLDTHVPWWRTVYTAQFTVPPNATVEEQAEVDAKREQRIQLIENFHNVETEIQRRIGEILQGSGELRLNTDQAFQLFDDALSVVNPPEKRFKGLQIHLSQCSRAVGELLPSLTLLTQKASRMNLLTDHEQSLFQSFVQKHDIFKWLSGPDAQFEADHPNILGYCIETYFPQMGISEEDVKFLAFVARHHENVYEEKEHRSWIKSEKPEERACALFLLVDTLSEAIDFKALGRGELVIYEEKLLPRLGDIVKRYNDKITSSNIWFDWAAYTVDTYIETFQYLETEFGVSVPKGLYARLVDSVLIEFTKLRIQDDARHLDREFIQSQSALRNLRFIPLPTFTPEQKDRLVVVITDLEERKRTLSTKEHEETVAAYTQSLLSVMNTLTDPHGVGQTLAREASHETWRSLKQKAVGEALWESQNDSNIGNNYSNVFLAGSEFYRLLSDKKTQQPFMLAIKAWQEDPSAIAEKIMAERHTYLYGIVLHIAELMHNGYSYSHGNPTDTLPHASAVNQWKSFAVALSIVDNMMLVLSGGDSDKIQGIKDKDQIERLKYILIYFHEQPSIVTEGFRKNTKRYPVVPSEIEEEFEKRRASAFQSPLTNPAHVQPENNQKASETSSDIDHLAARIMHTQWLTNQMKNPHAVTVIAPYEGELFILWYRRLDLGDGETGDAKLVPYTYLSQSAQDQNVASVYATQDWVQHTFLEGSVKDIYEVQQRIESLIRFLGKTPEGIYDGSNPLVESGANNQHCAFISTTLQLGGARQFQYDRTRLNQLQVYNRLPSVGDDGVNSTSQDFKKNDRMAFLLGLCVTLIKLRDNYELSQITIDEDVKDIMIRLGFGVVFKE